MWSSQEFVLIFSPSLSDCVCVCVCVCAGLKMCQSRNRVFWHMIGMGTAPEIHSIQFQAHSLEVF